MTAPLIAGAFAATVATCFSPKQNCALLATGAIDAARHEILVNAYGFTARSGIPGALTRGVDVGLIADPRTPWSGKRH